MIVRNFKRLLKIRRIDAGATQAALAKRIGKSLRTVQKYESGETTPSLRTVEKIAKVLEVSESDLLLTEWTGGGLHDPE